MSLLSKQLLIKRSLIPKAGKGLFTKKLIPKGTRIAEYIGDIKTWKQITTDPEFNPYVFYINRNYVIDSKNNKEVLARYINDAKGLHKTEHKNNCKFEVDGLKVYVIATSKIVSGAELFVAYGRDYWKAIKHNITHNL